MRPFVVPPAHMQTHLVPRNVLQRLVDRLDDEFDEADEVTERAVPVGGVSLQGEIGAIQLQQEAMADDRLVFDLQRNAERIQISLEAIVVLVLYDRGDDAGRRCSEKRLGVRATRLPRAQRGNRCIRSRSRTGRRR